MGKPDGLIETSASRRHTDTPDQAKRRSHPPRHALVHDAHTPSLPRLHLDPGSADPAAIGPIVHDVRHEVWPKSDLTVIGDRRIPKSRCAAVLRMLTTRVVRRVVAGVSRHAEHGAARRA